MSCAAAAADHEGHRRCRVSLLLPEMLRYSRSDSTGCRTTKANFHATRGLQDRKYTIHNIIIILYLVELKS